MPVDGTRIVSGSTFKSSLEARIREQAERAPRIFGRGADVARHVSSLNLLADHVAGLGHDDPLLYLAWELMRASSEDIDRESFEPSEGQARFLMKLGTEIPSPPSSTVEAFAELVGTGATDFFETERAGREQLRGKLGKAEGRVARLEREAADAAEVRVERDELRRQLENAERDRAEAEAKLAEFLDYAAAGAFAEPGTRTRSALNKARRQRRKIEGEVGLYELTKADGEMVFEVSFRDSDGDGRWRRLPAGTTLKQAREARERLSGSDGDDDDLILNDAQVAALEAGELDVVPDVGDDDTESEPSEAREEVTA
jgi:hypothetical protein